MSVVGVPGRAEFKDIGGLSSEWSEPEGLGPACPQQPDAKGSPLGLCQPSSRGQERASHPCPVHTCVSSRAHMLIGCFPSTVVIFVPAEIHLLEKA